MAEQLYALKAAIADVVTQCGAITTSTRNAEGASQHSIVDITAAERAISAAEDALLDAHRQIETEGMDALKRAKEAQSRFGQESARMTEIAREARSLAERLVSQGASSRVVCRLS